MDQLQSMLDTLLQGVDPSKMTSLDTMKFLLGVLLLQVLLRIAAEALTRISVKTDATWDNKIASALSTVAWTLGSFLGRFGFGAPKEVINDHIETAAKKVDEAISESDKT